VEPARVPPAGPGIPANESITFAWPAVSGVLGMRWLVVTVLGLRNGHTAVGAEAEVQWIIPVRSLSRSRPRRHCSTCPSGGGSAASVTVQTADR